MSPLEGIADDLAESVHVAEVPEAAVLIFSENVPVGLHRTGRMVEASERDAST